MGGKAKDKKGKGGKKGKKKAVGRDLSSVTTGFALDKNCTFKGLEDVDQHQIL